jgi:lipoprotein-releasing system permease protein
MKTSNPEIIIGNLLAQRLNVDIGDQLTIISPIDQSNFFGLPQMIDVTVSRIFHAQVLDFDDRVVFISPDLGNRLFLRKKNYDGIDIRLVDRKNLVDIKMQLEKTFSDHLSIKTWEDLHRGLISAMRVERLGALAVLCLIILVASFNLVSTLVLVIIQKIREIGILRAIGTSKINIKKIILTQGSLIGGVGVVIGIGISTVLIFIQNQYGIIPLPADVYFINQLPMVITTIDLLVVLIIAIFFVLFSGLIASKRATIIDIRESLQWEK